MLEASASADAQVSCYNAADATLTVLAEGGTGELMYSLDGGAYQSSYVFTGISSGTHSVVVMDEMECWVETEEVFIENPPMLEAYAEADYQVSCFNAADATLAVFASGGTGDYTYSLNGGTAQMSNVFNNLASGTYTVVVTDEMGCEVETEAIIIDNPLFLSASASSDDQVSCHNASDAILVVIPYGGTGQLMYELYDDLSGELLITQYSNVFTDLPAGEYYVVVSDEMECSFTTNTQEILNPPPITASIRADSQVSCYNDENGTITILASGGTGTLTYSLNGGNPQLSNIFSGLSAGTYMVEIVDEMECKLVIDAIIIDNPPMLEAYSEGSEQVSCQGGADGIVTVYAMGGTGEYTYSLNGGIPQSSNIFENLISGSYTVEVVDEMGCSVMTYPVVIENPSMLSAYVEADTQVSCFGMEDAELTVFATGGTGELTYSLNGGTPQLSNIFNDLAPGSYSIEIVDEMGCWITTETTIIENPELLEASASADNQVSCYNYNDATLTVTATGGTGELFYSLNGGAYQTSNIFSNLTAGTYSVMVMDEMECWVETETIIIDNPPMLEASVEVDSQVSCFNVADATITVFATGGTGELNYSLNGGPAQLSNIFTDLAAETYIVKIEDKMGCSINIEAIVIDNPPMLEANVEYDSQVSCFNTEDATIEVFANGGTGEYTYYLNGSTAQISNIFTNLAAGIYTIEVVDEMGCSAITDPVKIINPELLVATVDADTQVSCYNEEDGIITIFATGGTGNYSYILNDGIPQSSNIFTGLTHGTYVIEVLDEMGCSFETEAIIIDNPPMLQAYANIDSEITCHNYENGIISVNATGGTGEYMYSLNGEELQSSNIFTGLGHGVYDIKVIDEMGCIAFTNSLTLENPIKIGAELDITQITCSDNNDGEIIVYAGGGTGDYMYQLDSGDFQNENIFSNLAEGTYIINVIDSNYCMETITDILIINPEALEGDLKVRSNVSCNGAQDGVLFANAWGGTGDYIFTLFSDDNGEAISSRSDQTWDNLGAGNYRLLISDANNCMINRYNEIESPLPISVNYKPSCIDETVNVELTAQGGNEGYLYSVDGGETYHESGYFTNLTEDIVLNVLVNDANFCESEAFELPFSLLFTMNAESEVISDNVCYGVNDGIVEINATGGVAPYTYVIGDTEYTESTLTELAAGEFEIYVWDANRCLVKSEAIIEAGDPIDIELMSKTAADCFSNSGSLEVTVAGGNAPYDIEWSNGSTGPNADKLAAGTYTVSAIDLRGCAVTGDFDVDMLVYDEPEVKNVFTPNNDGINDFFVVSNLEKFPDNELVIVNRWGNEVFTTKSYNNSWDGSKLSEGTYFYVITVNVCNEYRTLNGYITVLE